MNRNTWIATVGGIVLVVVVAWLLLGTKISCHDSFWDKDKKVIEINR